MSVVIDRVTDVRGFAAAAEPFLVAREAENNLLLGIASGLAAQPDGITPSNAYLALGRAGSEVVGVAIWTTGYRVAVSYPADPSFAEALANDVLATSLEVGGFLGPPEGAGVFAAPFTRAGVAVRDGVAQLIYRLAEIPDEATAPGRLRAATPADRETLIEFWLGFLRETAGREVQAEDVADRVDARLALPDAEAYVWEDQGVVSMASARGRTPNGIRVGGVYTPPELRRRGYASACVASLSRRLLRSGRRFCFLFTDRANPTSNSIYRRIGYEQVAEVTELVFNDAPRR